MTADYCALAHALLSISIFGLRYEEILPSWEAESGNALHNTV